MTGRPWGIVLAAIAALVMTCVAGGQGGNPRLVAAAGDDHVWWIERDDRGAALMHASPLGEADRSAPVRRVAARFGTAPEAIAAVGDSVWIIFPPEAVAGGDRAVARREVLTLSTRLNPAVGNWYSVPTNGAQPRPSVEVPANAAAELLGFALDGPSERAEPWVLLDGGPAARLGVRLSAKEAEPFGLRLFRLQGSTWEAVAPPPGITGNGVRLVRTAAGRVALLAPDSAGGGSLVRFIRHDAGWDGPEPIGIEESTLLDWLVVDGRDAIATRFESGIDLAYLRGSPPRLLGWTSLPVPLRPWAIMGGRGGATVISASGEVASRTRIPAIGTFADAEVADFQPPGFGSGAWIHLPLLSALILFILLGLLFLRELRGASESPSVAATRPFELLRRVAALAIDAAPGAIVAMVVFDARPLDLVRVPFSSLDLATALPATVVAGSACLLGFLGEAIAGRSPGKWILGGEVVRRDGSRAGLGRHLGRNVLKFIALVAPPLVIPTLLSPDGSGVPERLTGTAVARRG
jgi:uncharacterized RDD family membrane protein YckC